MGRTMIQAIEPRKTKQSKSGCASLVFAGLDCVIILGTYLVLKDLPQTSQAFGSETRNFMIVAATGAVLLTGGSLLTLSAAIGTLLALIGLGQPGPKQFYTWVGIIVN